MHNVGYVWESCSTRMDVVLQKANRLVAWESCGAAREVECDNKLANFHTIS